MMAVPVSPVVSGYSVFSAYASSGNVTGFSKGTKFWLTEFISGNEGAIKSSTDGLTWTDETDDVCDTFSWNRQYVTFENVVSIGSVVVAYVNALHILGYDVSVPTGYFVLSNGSGAWTVTSIADFSLSTTWYNNLREANGKIFLLSRHLWVTNDGVVWTKAIDNGDIEPGGPTYLFEGITYAGGSYHAYQRLPDRALKSSSNLSSWSSVTVPLDGSNYAPHTIFSSGSYVYFNRGQGATLAVIKASTSDLSSWEVLPYQNSVNYGTLVGLYPIPVEDGFLYVTVTDYLGIAMGLGYIGYAVNNIKRLNILDRASLSTPSSVGSLPNLTQHAWRAYLSGGFIFICGQRNIFGFKFNTAWPEVMGDTPPNVPDFVLLPDTATTPYETAVFVDVLSNDTGEGLSISGKTNPDHGTTEISGLGILYTPQTGFSGVDGFGYTVVDANGVYETSVVTVTVEAPGATAGLIISNAPASESINLGEAYSFDYNASGGIIPLVWSATGLPAGLSINSSTGVVSGTPTSAGAYSVAITVTDSAVPVKSATATVPYTVVNTNTATIQGTLRLDTSDGVFAARKVYLYDYTTGNKVAETTSDGTTGAWSFTQVAPGEYFVVGAAQGDDLNVPRDFDAMGVITVV